MKTTSGSRAVICALLLLSCSIVSASDFVGYEGKDAIQEGNGGEKKTVDGIDFWSNGAPPRKFKVIGFITDSRLKTGVIGMIRMSGLDSSVAKEAKKNGGDAVILTNTTVETKAVMSDTQTNTTGTANVSGNMNNNGSFNATTTVNGQSNSNTVVAPMQQQHTRYAVIRYIADDSNTASNVPR